MPSYEDYLEYQDYLGKLPDDLNKYVDLSFMLRLKGITLLCGMINASKHMYKFNLPNITRFDHSLNDAKITWKLTQSREKTLASLFHDVASPTWCHVVDYLNKDFVAQESTEEKTEEILRKSDKLLEYLARDGIDFSKIVDFKIYSEADLPRPKLCADRVENTISTAFAWMGNITVDEAKCVIDSLRLYKNEDGETEIGLNNYEAALMLVNINREINRLTHTKEDNFMMLTASEILKRLIDTKAVSYDDLFLITESDLIDIIEASQDEAVKKFYQEYKTAQTIPDIYVPKIKEIVLNPLVKGKRFGG